MVPIARLHLITPAAADPNVLDQTLAALEAGAPWIQARVKHGADRHRLDFVRRVTLLCESRYATCIVDDRVDLAVAANAGGVHLGAEDLPVATARAILGPDAVIGATCRTADDARRARDEGANYLGVGPVHATTTKAGLPAPIGLRGLEAVTDAVDLPVIAIGGITVARVPEVLKAGAHGVAVIAAVFGVDDVAGAVIRFRRALGENDSEGADASGRPVDLQESAP